MVHMLNHVADKHSKKPVQIGDIKEQNIPRETEKYKEVLKTLEYDQFKCVKCKNLSLKDDSLKTFIEDGKNMCSFCTILSYGDN